MIPITAAMLYDVIQCEHRLTMDLFFDPAKRDEINPFVKLLWEKSTTHERDVIACIEIPILDLSSYSGEEKEQKTIDAMYRGVPLIYRGRITADDLLGEPTLLRREGNGYVAGTIKCGSGEHGDGDSDDTKPKKHYGVQLALYTDILQRLNLEGSGRPFVWDVHGKEVVYNLDNLHGIQKPWTMWEVYREKLDQARQIIAKSYPSTPANSGNCKFCHWYSSCLAELENTDDLTLLPELGRARRDVIVRSIQTISDLAAANINEFISGKKTKFSGIGSTMLHKFHQRAKLSKTDGASPYLTASISLPDSETELFFDIEVDPIRDFCYLHGFVERHGGENRTERYIPFFADVITAEAEEQAFREAWQFINNRQPCIIYYYSKYERTVWRKLQLKYPSVCTAADIEELFHPCKAVDLYFDVVKKATEWPTRDYTIKSLATFLGFNWRDTHPSGAASIEWFDRWIRTGDQSIKQRILDYNEDDCVATRVVLDGIRDLQLKADVI